MSVPVEVVVPIIVLLISISATVNAYLLRGGRLAWSQVLIVLAMISFMLSVILGRFLSDNPLVQEGKILDVLFVLGFVFLLAASLKMHSSLK